MPRCQYDADPVGGLRVGAFLVIALLRMLFSMALPPLLVVCYAVVFVLAAFVPKEFFKRGL